VCERSSIAPQLTRISLGGPANITYVPHPRRSALCLERVLRLLYGALVGRNWCAEPHEAWWAGRVCGRGGVSDSGARFCLGWRALLGARKVPWPGRLTRA
jgi:hypothetical protein